MSRARVRDLGLAPGRFAPGPFNAITDVTGVRVGHSTLIRDDTSSSGATRHVRTGVTAVLPNETNIFEQRVFGSGFVLNGAGEVAGLTQVMEWGLIETPILLTNTLSVGSVSSGVVQHMLKRFPGIGREQDVIIPMVGECDDSWLNDIRGGHVTDEHVAEAIDSAASGPVAEGNVGGGTGMITCDFKGGIGTSSRVLPASDGGHTIGVLVMSNFGHVRDLRMAGIPVGSILADEYEVLARREHSYGSIIAIVATDAPLLSYQLHRVAKRAALGIGRAGSHAAHGSGEIVVAFSTGNTVPHHADDRVTNVSFLLDPSLNPIYEACIEATEEAILNAICQGESMHGADGHFSPALPLDRVREIIGHYGTARQASKQRA